MPAFVSWLMKANGTGVTTPRAMPDRLSDIINVLDYGADPTGSADSSPAIQNAFNAAFGTAGSPHGFTNAALNKSVFVPCGHYILGSTLVLNQVYGGHIFGGGRSSTQLDAQGATCVRSNGMSYTRIESISFNCTTPPSPSGIGFDLNWDNSNPAGAVGLHSNNFVDCLFVGGTQQVRIANAGFDGAYNLFLGCYFLNCVTGVETIGANAVGQAVYSGNAQSCDTAFKATGGGFALLQGISGQQQNAIISGGGTDILLGVNAKGPTHISGYRAEGPIFLKQMGIDCPVTFSGDNHASIDAGAIFAEAHGPMIIEGCYSAGGKVVVRGGAQVNIQFTYFRELVGVAAWLDAPAAQLWYPGDPSGHSIGAVIELEQVMSGPISNVGPPPGDQVTKQRKFTTNGTTITTQNYTVV